MTGLTWFFVVGCVVAGAFLAWLITKPGKNGLRICNEIFFLHRIDLLLSK